MYLKVKNNSNSSGWTLRQLSGDVSFTGECSINNAVALIQDEDEALVDILEQKNNDGEHYRLDGNEWVKFSSMLLEFAEYFIDYSGSSFITAVTKINNDDQSEKRTVRMVLTPLRYVYDAKTSNWYFFNTEAYLINDRGQTIEKV